MMFNYMSFSLLKKHTSYPHFCLENYVFLPNSYLTTNDQYPNMVHLPKTNIALNIELPKIKERLLSSSHPSFWGQPKQTNGGALPWGPTHPAEPRRARRFFSVKRTPGTPELFSDLVAGRFRFKGNSF